MKDKELTESYFSSVTMPELAPAAIIAEAVRHETGMFKAVEFRSKLKS
jgi:hypothetical protein